MKHSDKIKLARRIMTKKEIRDGVPMFDSYAWRVRKTFKKAKVYRQMNKNKKTFAESLIT